MPFGEPITVRYNALAGLIRTLETAEETMTLRTYHLSLIACAALWLLSGCFSQRTQTTGPQLDDILPTDRTPMEFSGGGLFRSGTTWQTISIDEDAAPEYLLFYTYDNGQVGAVIYDEQAGTTEATSLQPEPVPNQPSGLYVPYRLEPSYWAGAGSVGYIAPPGTTDEEIIFEQVQRAEDDVSEPPAGGTSSNSNDELVIHGGGTVLTVVWWQNPFNGYGLTQIAATGGLVRPVRQGRDEKGPITSITGLTPLTDYLARSVLCDDKLYQRTVAAEDAFVHKPVYRGAVKYVPSNRGVVFCQGPPQYPFYPEGVVLAFLRPEDPEDTQQSVQDRADYRYSFVNSKLAPEPRGALRSAGGPNRL